MTDCKQLTKTFGSKRPAIDFINSCALLKKFDTRDIEDRHTLLYSLAKHKTVPAERGTSAW